MKVKVFRNILLTILSICATYANSQNQAIVYSGEYRLILQTDSIFYVHDGFRNNIWNHGKYVWLNDTIFFNVIPIYDTLLTIEKPKGISKRELVLSNDTRANLIVKELIKPEYEILVVHSNDSTIIQLELIDHNLINEEFETVIFEKQVIEGYPEFLIRKRKKLGYHDSSGQFIKVLTLEEKLSYLDRKYLWFKYKIKRYYYI